MRDWGRKSKEALLDFVYWLIEHHGAIWGVKWVRSWHQTHTYGETHSSSSSSFYLSLGCHLATFLWKMNDFEAWMRGSFDSAARLVYLSVIGASPSFSLQLVPLRWTKKTGQPPASLWHWRLCIVEQKWAACTNYESRCTSLCSCLCVMLCLPYVFHISRRWCS